jgi:Ohr subfamily peroxiredoxin
METIDQQLYTTTVSSKGGRDGHVRSADGVLDLPMKAPEELGGPGGASNPEQLFAAGYAACFHSALALVASSQGVDASDSTVTSTVSLGKGGEGQYVLSVEIVAELPSADAETTQRVVDQAHKTCPYSRATSGNIEVTVRAA